MILQKKMSKEIKTAKDIGDKLPELFKGTVCPQVLGMDNFKDKEKAIVALGGQEKFDAMRAKLAETSNVYSIVNTVKTTMRKYYQVLRDVPLNMGKLLYDNVQKVCILQGLQSENPSFNPQLDASDTYVLSGFLQHHPQGEALQQKADNLDRELLNDWLANDGANQARTELVILDKAVPLPKQLGDVDPGYIDVRVDVVVNGESLTGVKDVQKQMLMSKEDMDMGDRAM